MKKIAIFTIAALGMMSANAQTAIEKTNFGSNWAFGLDGGVTTPLKGQHFIGDMRGTAGAHLHKQISPTFGLGIEAAWGVNTSSWDNHGPKSKTAFDSHYVGLYGSANLFNLFGYNCGNHFFDIEAVAGAGWGHLYRDWATTKTNDWNYFATKAGLNFNFNVCQNFTISLKPSVNWNMSDPIGDAQTKSTAFYNKNYATFDCQIGLTYKFGKGFKCVEVMDPALIADLNAQINALRGDLDGCNKALAAEKAKSADLDAKLRECLNRPVPAPVVEKTNEFNSVRFVFFKVGSSVINKDQLPNVEMIAAYLKNHPDATVEIKGYASPEGPADLNERLAAARAESVKTSLVKKYGIAADRIKASGEGIGDMFEEDSWNRVSICTVENSK